MQILLIAILEEFYKCISPPKDITHVVINSITQEKLK